MKYFNLLKSSYLDWRQRRKAHNEKVRTAVNRLRGQSAVALQDWFQSKLGAQVLEQETAAVQPILDGLFGYHILQLGGSEHTSLIENSRVGHKIIFSPRWLDDEGCKPRQAVASAEELPLPSDSIDVVLLHHGLDFSADSHGLLREATRVLRPGGQLLIVGFNPISSWGVSRLFTRRRKVPWRGQFISKHRLTDWLKLLNLQIESSSYAVHFPPLAWAVLLNAMPRWERFAQRINSPLGAVYVIRCTKQIVPITPIVNRWRAMRSRRPTIPATENARVRIH